MFVYVSAGSDQRRWPKINALSDNNNAVWLWALADIRNDRSLELRPGRNLRQAALMKPPTRWFADRHRVVRHRRAKVRFYGAMTDEGYPVLSGGLFQPLARRR